MKHILRTEWIKTKGFSTFWTLLGLHSILFIVFVLIVSQLNIQLQGVTIARFFAPEHLWQTTAWLASWFNLILAIIIAVLTGNELSFSTFRKMIVEGYSRFELMLGKLFLSAALSVYVFIIVTITGIAVGYFSGAWTTLPTFIHFKYTLIIAIQALAYMVLAITFVMIFRSTALSIILYLLYFALIEPIIRFFFNSPWDSYFPVKIISNLTPMPNFLGIIAEDLQQLQSIDPNTLVQVQNAPTGITLLPSVLIAIAYTLIFIGVSTLIFKHRDF